MDCPEIELVLRGERLVTNHLRYAESYIAMRVSKFILQFYYVSKYQKGVYYSGIKIFNYLPQNIKDLSGNAKKFKVALKRFLSMGSFYSLDEYFDWISRTDLGAFI